MWRSALPDLAGSPLEADQAHHTGDLVASLLGPGIPLTWARRFAFILRCYAEREPS
jgi:hypothetical protein